MATDVAVRGPLWGSQGSPVPLTAALSGAQRIADSHGRFVEAVLAGRVFYIAVAGGTATAYSGGAAGTPLVAIHNPSNSNKIALPLLALISNRAQASAAGQVSYEAFGGVSVAPTGTQTVPRSALTMIQSGSAMLGFSNAALTGSTALSFIAGLATYYWATAAAAWQASNIIELAGIMPVIPGNQLAIGASSALTSHTHNVTLFWEEVPNVLYQP